MDHYDCSRCGQQPDKCDCTPKQRQRNLFRQIAEVRAEAQRIRELLGPDLCRVAVLRWPSLKDVK